MFSLDYKVLEHDPDKVFSDWLTLQEEINTLSKTTRALPTRTHRISQLRRQTSKILQAAMPELNIVDQSTTEPPVEDSATPSITPNLPKASDFYKTWENYFVTEVLQAITCILNEDKPDFIISEHKKSKSYELLHSLMTSMSFPDLCEGLALTEDNRDILLQKLFTESRANYSSDMSRFTAIEVMNRAYEEWQNGTALQKQEKDMQRD